MPYFKPSSIKGKSYYKIKTPKTAKLISTQIKFMYWRKNNVTNITEPKSPRNIDIMGL